MKTDELVSLLSRQDPGAARAAAAPRFPLALLCGLVAAVLLMMATLGIREDWNAAVRGAAMWWKLAYAVSIASAALLATWRLSRPGRTVGKAWIALALPPAVAITAALVTLAAAPAGTRGTLVQGDTWRVCPILIAGLSVPAFAAVMWAIRGFAPTRLRLAGACGGLLAGGIATTAYCVHCPEIEVAFWGIWYTAGMLIPAVAGALLGPRVLRW